MKYVVAVALALSFFSTEVRAQTCKSTANSWDWTYTRVLIPVLATHLPGAAGSSWQTDVWVTNPTDQPVVYLFHPPCNQACCCAETNTICPQSTRLDGDNQPQGRWIAAPVGGLLRFDVRLRDLTQNASSAGVELPIVREDEFVSDQIHLLAVPRDPRFRVTVRFYGLDASPVLSVDQVDQSGTVIRNDIVLLGRPNVEYGYLVAPGYAQLSLDPSTQAETPLRIRIRSLSTGVSFWAFASVTNNDTSEVTLILPAR